MSDPTGGDARTRERRPEGGDARATALRAAAAVKAIQQHVEKPLRWVQTGSLPRGFELRAGKEGLATLRWQKMLGSLAVGESASGAWSFKRGGFLNPRV